MGTPNQPPRPRVNYTQELRENIGQVLTSLADTKMSQAKLEVNQQRLEAKLEANQQRLEASSQALSVQVATLPSRQEIAAEFDKRVSSVAYQSDRKALEDRIEKLEQAPRDLWSKAAVVVSMVSVLVAILAAMHVI